MSYRWPGIPNGDYSFDHGRAVWNKIINYLRRLSEKLDADIVDATADRRGMMTAADKAAFDAVPDTYALKAGDLIGNELTRTSPGGHRALALQPGTDGVASDVEVCDFGWNVHERDGACLGLRSASHALNPGQWRLYARDALNSSVLVGTPDGALTWNSNQVITIADTATTTTAGAMSAADKAKLDKINRIELDVEFPYIAIMSTDKYLRIGNGNGGTIFESGACVYLNGKDRIDNPGDFAIHAYNGTTRYTLRGKPDGTLTWNNHNVLTDAVSYAKVADLPSLYTSINFSSVSVSNATYTNLGSFTPSKTGKWLIMINVSIDANATGYRRLVIANSATGNYPDRFRYIQTDGTTANSTLLQLSWLGNFTSISTVYFNVYQTSGNALNASGGYRAYYLGG